MKTLRKTLNLADLYLTVASIKAPYGYGYSLSASLAATLTQIIKELDIVKKCTISKSAYVKNSVWYDENGYGNYGTPRKEYAEAYDVLVMDENVEKLVCELLNKMPEMESDIEKLNSKGFKKIINTISKELKSRGIDPTLYALKLLNGYKIVIGHYDRFNEMKKFDNVLMLDNYKELSEKAKEIKI